MTDKFGDYKQAHTPLPAKNRRWRLYGAGMDNLGVDSRPEEVDMPTPGVDELLVRHDACGLCFSDIKVISLGEEHPRLYRNLRHNPITLGHEVAMTVVDVGENLRDQYKVGDRFTIQADVFVDGIGYAYGYEIQGGLSLYNIIDRRILDGDDGNYLIPVQPSTGYAESALTEPWACVTAAYQLEYRTSLKDGGVAWFIGAGAQRDYTISAGFDQRSHPATVLLSRVPAAFGQRIQERARALGIEVLAADDINSPPISPVDDVIFLGAPAAQDIEQASRHLADHGIVALVANEPLPEKVQVDIGRVHYNRWVYVGGTGTDIARAYSDLPVRSTLRPGGRAWFVGAGGPMGRMHVQRAIQTANTPGLMVCTDVSDVRLADLEESYGAEALAKGIEFICLNPLNREDYQAGMARFRADGFDDIIVLAPVPGVIADAAGWLAPAGVMNVFAGVARGTAVALDLSDVFIKGTRIIGHSASTIDDLRLMLHMAESGELSPNRSVAAIGSLSAAKHGLQAVKDTIYPGKVVIYPQIRDFPLTALPDLKDSLPTVFAKLKDGREWTTEAENEFLRLMLA